MAGSDHDEHVFWQRAQATTFLQKIDDATGNKDGVLGNEAQAKNTVPSSSRGVAGLFDKNPILFSLQQNLAAGWSKSDENTKLNTFLAATEKTFGPVTSLPKPGHVDVDAWNAFRLDKAISLVRFGRTPAAVSDHVVKASGSAAAVRPFTRRPPTSRA